MTLLSNYWTSSPQTESRGKKCFMTEQKKQDIMTEMFFFFATQRKILFRGVSFIAQETK